MCSRTAVVVYRRFMGVCNADVLTALLLWSSRLKAWQAEGQGVVKRWSSVSSDIAYRELGTSMCDRHVCGRARVRQGNVCSAHESRGPLRC
jgi:hypothetical protein